MVKLSTEQLERLSERVFKVLRLSGYLDLDAQTDERIEERMLDTIADILEEDSRNEDRLSREAERLVQQQSQIAKSSGKSFELLVEEVKARLAKSKKVVLGDSPDRSDALAEKVVKALWKLDGIDFFSENFKIQNCVARAIHRFRIDDDRILDTVEKVTNKRCSEEPYSHAWCLAFDKYYIEVLERIQSHKVSDEQNHSRS